MIRGAERRYSDKVNPGDGVNEEEDCNDEDALVYPGAEEVPFKKMEYQAQQGMVVYRSLRSALLQKTRY